MEGFKSFPSLIAISATMLVTFSVVSVEAQISSPCTASMVASFTPCINFITGSTGNGASPTPGCCDSLESLMSGSMDCACLIVTGNVPISLPINQALAITLPQACKSTVPLQCKATGAPLPAPGPVLFAPPIAPVSHVSPKIAPVSHVSPKIAPVSPISPVSPAADSPFSPRASKESTLAAPPAGPPGEPPASPPVHSVAPTETVGIRPVVTPSSALNPAHIPSPYVLLIFMGMMLFK